MEELQKAYGQLLLWTREIAVVVERRGEEVMTSHQPASELAQEWPSHAAKRFRRVPAHRVGKINGRPG